jgi:transcriptional regulator GlxA family with amidase domain
MHEIFDFIGANLHEKFTIKALAAKFNITEQVLNTGFEQVFAIPVADFILLQRMMTAYNLLLKTKASLNNIAWKTGYRNRLALTVDFEAYYEYDPITIRNAQ